MSKCKLTHVKYPKGMSKKKKRRSRIMKNLHLTKKIKFSVKHGKSRKIRQYKKRKHRHSKKM